MTWCIASHETPVRLDYLLIASWTLNWDLISPCHRMAFAYGNKHKHCMFLFFQNVKQLLTLSAPISTYKLSKLISIHFPF